MKGTITTTQAKAHQELFVALSDIESLSCDLQTALEALDFFREQLGTTVDGMDTSTEAKAAAAASLFSNSWSKYESTLGVIQKALGSFKTDLDTTLEGAFVAYREEASVKEVG